MKLHIDYMNGSKAGYEHTNMSELYEAANRISYSGGKVKRVELETEPGSFRALWEASWDAASKKAGLKMPQ